MKEIKDGWVRLQINPEYVACLDGGEWHGWLFKRHPDGQLVSFKKLEEWEIMQAEDQRDYNIVINGGHNLISRSGGLRFG